MLAAVRALLLSTLLASAVLADDAAPSNYLLACRGCHLTDGRGVPPDVPSLRNELGRIVATDEGRAYLVRVPGVSQSRLNDQEIAAVLNWILAEFNADTLPANFRPFSTSEVTAARGQVLADPKSYRRTLRLGDG